MTVRLSQNAEQERYTVNIRTYAKLAAFMAGFVGLGVELAAERLLAPAFGTTLDLWSLIIGLTFASLSAGYEIGGRYIDRNPTPRFISLCLLGAALWTFGVAAFGRSIAFRIQEWTFDFGGVTFGIFLSVLILITIQPFLLGMITPAAIRLIVSSAGASGASAGTIFALTTVGALLGTFIPVLVLIPFIGVQLTFIAVGAVGLFSAIPGLTGMIDSSPAQPAPDSPPTATTIPEHAD
ncbi:MAG: fused MFS/spermidine synthase [Thermomicrobiales bacterium]